MDLFQSGAAIPMWILGAPLLGILIEWMRTPKPREGYDRAGTTRSTVVPGTTPASRTTGVA
jgi:hypothetical protein